MYNMNIKEFMTGNQISQNKKLVSNKSFCLHDRFVSNMNNKDFTGIKFHKQKKLLWKLRPPGPLWWKFHVSRMNINILMKEYQISQSWKLLRWMLKPPGLFWWKSYVFNMHIKRFYGRIKWVDIVIHYMFLTICIFLQHCFS